ncbi:50S ribosomal protein L15 [Alphaproteobacteria bacterium]|nr:50S ribosomal protein L15 [Alphaproteobacteria bacterium]
MRLNEIKDNEAARQNRKRVGRGIGSGTGKTAGKGHKGQKARAGVAIKGFEGGQMPLHRRLPKYGFTSPNRKNYASVGIDIIQSAIDSGKIDPKKQINAEVLKLARVIKKAKDGVKLLGNGTITSNIDIEVTAFTASAKESIEKAGGKVSKVVRKIKDKDESLSTKVSI